MINDPVTLDRTFEPAFALFSVPEDSSTSLPYRTTGCRITLSDSPPILNEDVQFEIIRYLLPWDLARAARVCRRWLQPARKLLYHRFTCDTSSPATAKQHWILWTTPHLRKLIHHLVIIYDVPRYDAADAPTFGWIALLPERSLQTVEFAKVSHANLIAPILDFPAVRTASHIITREHALSAEQIGTILGYQNLQRLSIACDFAFAIPQKLLRLTQLSVWYTKPHILPTPSLQGVIRLLGALDPRCALERFDLRLTCTPDDTPPDNRLQALTTALRPHLPTLRHVSIISPQWPMSLRPFMDALVPSMPALQKLHCGYETYTSALIERLPAGVRELMLGWGVEMPSAERDPMTQALVRRPHASNTPFPADDYAKALVKRRAAGPLDLRTVTIVLPRLVDDGCLPMARVCREMGIAFRAEHIYNSLVDVLS